jgi:hypothetical protein
MLLQEYVCSSLALVVDFVVIDKQTFGPIAMRYNVRRLADMLVPYRNEERVLQILQYYEHTFEEVRNFN